MGFETCAGGEGSYFSTEINIRSLGGRPEGSKPLVLGPFQAAGAPTFQSKSIFGQSAKYYFSIEINFRPICKILKARGGIKAVGFGTWADARRVQNHWFWDLGGRAEGSKPVVLGPFLVLLLSQGSFL